MKNRAPSRHGPYHRLHAKTKLDGIRSVIQALSVRNWTIFAIPSQKFRKSFCILECERKWKNGLRQDMLDITAYTPIPNLMVLFHSYKP